MADVRGFRHGAFHRPVRALQALRTEPNPYALNRYDFEAWRHWKILDTHLADRSWMVSGQYTLLDMAVSGWARAVPFALGAEAWEQLPHVKRLLDAVSERPAAQRAAALKDRYAFKTELDDEARRAMFRRTGRKLKA